MKRRNSLILFTLFLIVVLLLPALPVAAQTQGTLIDLGTLGGNYSEARAVNLKGQVAGISTLANGELRAFLWQNGQIINLGTLGGNRSDAYAINNRGQIAGRSEVASGQTHAFIWKDGNMLDMINPDCPFSGAYGINDKGVVVGETCFPTAPYGHAFLWKNGQWTDLGDLGGGYSVAYAVNNRGQVAGASTIASGELHAFRWQAGVMTDLGTLGGTITQGWGINNKGQVVGMATYPPNEDFLAFLWTKGTLKSLGPAPDSTQSFALAINDQSEVVGFPCFHWKNGVMTNPLYPNGCEAYDINNDGQIVGIYYPDQTDGRAFIWTP